MKRNLFYIVLSPTLIYLIFSVIPNYYGCFLPEKMCLIGIGKASDFLTISISTIPVIIILEAYRVWRKQKTAELLAVDAREIYRLLKALQNESQEFEKEIKRFPGTTTTRSDAYKNFKALYDKLKRETELFDALLGEDNSIHLKFFNDFYLYFSDYESTLVKIDMYRIWTGENSENRELLHGLEVIKGIELKELNSRIEKVFPLLTRIILHKY